METAKQIAQWVIDNRYPKSENEKVTDVEMYYELVTRINKLSNRPIVMECATCKHREVSKFVDPCFGCYDRSNWQTNDYKD